LNAIEGIWMLLRVVITKDWNRPHTLEWTARAWKAEWKKYPQEAIQNLVLHQEKVREEVEKDQGGNAFHG